MKNLLIITLFTLTINTSFSQWNINAYRSDIADIEIIDKDTLIMIGAKGEITRTTNGGVHWSTQVPFSSFSYSWFSDIHFPTKNVGYISGGSWFGLTNILIKTIDGGQTWDSLSSGTGSGGNFINKIHFINKDTGLMIADNRQILKTIDGGITRLPVGSASLALYSDFTFVNNNIGFFATSERISSSEYIYSIFKTTDFAQTFTTVYIDTMTGVTGYNNRAISKVHFIDNINGFAVGGNGLFMKTVDGGNTWSRTFLMPYNSLTSVHFINISTGYVNNAGGIYKTTDGGNSWNVQQVNPVSTISRINFLNDTIGYALGQNAVYKTYNGGNFTGIKENEEKLKLSIYPNPTSGIFSIEVENSELNYVRLIDINGRELIKSTTKSSFDISAYSSGVYFLEIGTNKGKAVKRIVKK
ncbi:YCF48-related protein [Flavobacteriales bacterium]|nr:YCF48-related protein [Flavobacteriales bacterium]